jgi:hypothetical protein
LFDNDYQQVHPAGFWRSPYDVIIMCAGALANLGAARVRVPALGAAMDAAEAARAPAVSHGLLMPSHCSAQPLPKQVVICADRARLEPDALCPH